MTILCLHTYNPMLVTRKHVDKGIFYKGGNILVVGQKRRALCSHVQCFWAYVNMQLLYYTMYMFRGSLGCVWTLVFLRMHGVDNSLLLITTQLVLGATNACLSVYPGFECRAMSCFLNTWEPFRHVLYIQEDNNMHLRTRLEIMPFPDCILQLVGFYLLV